MRSAKRVADLGAYSIAMGLRGTPDAAPRLLKKLDQARDEDARGYVAMSLGMVGAREAIESLQETLVDAEEQPLLQTRTGLALGMLGDESVAESLLEVLEKSLDDEEGEARQIAAVSALGYIGDKRGVEILCEIVTDKEDKYSVAVRESAVVALGLCGDRTSRPWRTMLTLGSNYLANTKTLTSGDGTGVLDLK
jgi:bilin biosynthesis protein